ncbi:MAG: pilus assembly protein TadG-related protein [Terriglobales bacterium]
MRPGSRPNHEQGIVIMLVAVVMLFVVGAMAALSIDVVTIYTARSEAQLAADSAALAAARVLANSGATSDTTGGSMANAWILAQAVALQVAEQNQVGGVNLTASQVTIPAAPGGSNTNPTITISVQVTTLPTFFARIWGSKFITVGASATAEAYNPSHATGTSVSSAPPVAPICVKPWLLPNMDPSAGGAPIFDPTSGAITTTSLLGWSPSSATAVPLSLSPACSVNTYSGTCTQASITSTTNVPPTTPAAWQYYPGDDATTFPHPTNSLPSCTTALTTNYQESIAGCVQTPISCNSSANIDLATYPNPGPSSPNRDSDTTDAVTCLTHTSNNNGDKVSSATTSPPFQFVAGDDNPIAALADKDVMVSDSLVTVPVTNVLAAGPPGGWTKCTGSPCTVQIIGFVQLFLNPNGDATATSGSVNTTVINLAGCGANVVGTPILGNGASPVAVRLISPPLP